MVIRIRFKGKRVLSFRLGRLAPHANAHRHAASLACWLSCGTGQDGVGALQTFALALVILLICTFLACRAKADLAPHGTIAPLIAGGDLSRYRWPGPF